MKVRKIKTLGTVKGKRNPSVVPQKAAIVPGPLKKRRVPWIKCPKCNASMERETLEKTRVKKSGGCNCMSSSKIVYKYLYSCSSCDYSYTKTS